MRIEVNHQDLAYVQSRLKGMEGQAPRALRNAVNRTATQARKRLAEVAQARYTVKSGGFNAHARIKNATIANPTAEIRVKGRPLTQPRFHYTRPKSGVKIEVIKGRGLKQAVNSLGNKAFMGKAPNSGAPMVYQRKGKRRLPVHAFHGPSVPKMLEKVYRGGQVTDAGLKKEIEEMYHKNVEAEIGKVLATQ